MAKKESNYILKALVALPNYDRKDLKLGMSIVLDEVVGDKFAARGFLVKANAAVSKSDKASDDLSEKVEALTKDNAALEEANKALSEQLQALTKDNAKK